MESIDRNDTDIKKRFNARLNRAMLEDIGPSDADRDPLAAWMHKERRRLQRRLQQLLDESAILTDPAVDPTPHHEDDMAAGLASAMIAQLREPPGFTWESVIKLWDEEGKDK
jgi:hypothetical protein